MLRQLTSQLDTLEQQLNPESKDYLGKEIEAIFKTEKIPQLKDKTLAELTEIAREFISNHKQEQAIHSVSFIEKRLKRLKRLKETTPIKQPILRYILALLDVTATEFKLEIKSSESPSETQVMSLLQQTKKTLADKKAVQLSAEAELLSNALQQIDLEKSDIFEFKKALDTGVIKKLSKPILEEAVAVNLLTQKQLEEEDLDLSLMIIQSNTALHKNKYARINEHQFSQYFSTPNRSSKVAAFCIGLRDDNLSDLRATLEKINSLLQKTNQPSQNDSQLETISIMQQIILDNSKWPTQNFQQKENRFHFQHWLTHF